MFVIGFVFNLSYAIPTYINSTFLAQFTSDKLVGILYTASSILAISMFIEMPNIMRRFGNFKTTLGLLGLLILSLIGLVLETHPLFIFAAFILNFVSISLINFCLDVFLEDFSPNTTTGKIRGGYLTTISVAWLISPILSSYILQENNFNNIYTISAFLLIPVIALILFNLRGLAEPRYSRTSFLKSFGEAWADRNIKAILISQFLLQFFYAWMIIYTPIYLHEVINFDWKTIGIMFSIMLIPFVILDAPLGRLADKHGEKKMLTIGFCIIALATFLIAFFTDHNVIVWTALLFLSRIGAATIETMVETYFFKKIDATKTNLISFSRMMRPFAYILSPIIATILFAVFDMQGLFIFLGFLMLYGIRYSTAIDDVK